MLERTVEKEILDWLEKPTGALLVSGARQVGKTFTIRACLKKTECSYLEINLIDHPELVPVMEQTTSVDDLIINLSTVYNYSFESGKTVVFIDEVQEVKDILTRIKFWVDDGRFRYILSGSLLGIELKSPRSAPVGYLREVVMHPMDFEEFLSASGVREKVVEYIHGCYTERRPVSDLVHEKMMMHFRRYLVVGGMPAAVQEYANSGDISRVTTIQQGILEMYKLDFTKYERQEKKLKLIAIFSRIPAQLLKQNRRFNYSDLQKGLRFERVEDSFLWLTSAGVVIPVYNATEPRIALSQNAKSSLVKLYSSDVGLLTCQYGNAIRLKILLGDEKINLGGVFENAVAQELNCHGFQSYFYNSHKSGELDFLIEKDGEILPIEVKSGKDYYVHSALSKVTENTEYEMKEAYVLGNCNISQKGKLMYFPIYMCTFIKDDMVIPILEPVT